MYAMHGVKSLTFRRIALCQARPLYSFLYPAVQYHLARLLKSILEVTHTASRTSSGACMVGGLDRFDREITGGRYQYDNACGFTGF